MIVFDVSDGPGRFNQFNKIWTQDSNLERKGIEIWLICPVFFYFQVDKKIVKHGYLFLAKIDI